MPTNSKDKEYKYFMLVCLLIKGTIVSLEITSTQQRRVKYSIYMVLIKPFSLTRNLHSLSTYTKKKNVSLAHVPTRYSSCIRRPLKKKKSTRSYKNSSVHYKRFLPAPLPKMSLFVGGSLQAGSACHEMFWYSVQGQKHDHSSRVWQEVIDPKAIFFPASVENERPPSDSDSVGSNPIKARTSFGWRPERSGSVMVRRLSADALRCILIHS